MTKKPQPNASLHTLSAIGALHSAEEHDGRLRLTFLDDARKAVEDETQAVVRDLRLSGATWESIGNALNVSRQAAQQRYGR